MRHLYMKSALLLLSLAVPALFGCNAGQSTPLGEVTGKVIDGDGQPLTGCQVVYAHEESGVAGSADVRADGTYTILYRGKPGLPANTTYKICVVPKDPEPLSGEEYDAYMNASPRRQREIDQQRQKGLAEIPAKYIDLRTSGLEFHVEEGKQVNDIAIMEGEAAGTE